MSKSKADATRGLLLLLLMIEDGESNVEREWKQTSKKYGNMEYERWTDKIDKGD